MTPEQPLEHVRPRRRRASSDPDPIDAAWDAIEPEPPAAVMEPPEGSEPPTPVAEEPQNGRAPAAFLAPEQKRYIHALEDVEVARKELVRRRGGLYPSTEEWIRQARAGVGVEKLGLGYEAGAHEGVSLTLSRLRESRGELSAELSISRWAQHLYQARFNLSSGQARTTTAKLLEAHPFGKAFAQGEKPDWREILEQLCVRVLELERVGDPTEEVGMLEMATVPPRVMDPFLPDAVSLVWASQGTGKSTVGVGVAVSLETYTEVIPGWHPREERRVMVLDWEASAQEWNDRIRRVCAGIGIDPPKIAYRRMRRPLADQVEEIAAECDRRDVGFLLIDAFERAAGASSDGSTYEDKANRFFTAVDRIARPALIFDHIAGEDLKGGVGRITVKSIGSVLKGAWARATYDLKRDPNLSVDGRDELVLHNVKMNDAAKLAPYEFAIRSEGDRGPISFEHSRISSPELLASLPLREQLRRHLVGGAMPVKELAELMNVTDGAVRSIVSRYAEFQSLPGVGVTLVAQEELPHAG